jgi:hypothetical protein
MNESNVIQMPEPQPAPGLRSIAEIVADLSRPVNPQRLKQRKASNKSNEMLTYLPWYQAIRYLDKFAPGWSYEVRSINQIGENLVMTVRISIPCVEGIVFREASALEPVEDAKRYGDAATNAESAALRRAAAKFGLCLSLYDK